MPPTIPALSGDFAANVDAATALAAYGERLRAEFSPAHWVHTELADSRLEQMYEACFLRIFMAWEGFLEDSMAHYLCGYTSTAAVLLKHPPCATLADAHALIPGKEKYAAWTPQPVIDRSQRLFKTCPHEEALSGLKSRLEALSAVRHRVAHRSSFAKLRFDQATTVLCGRRYQTPGEFLRDDHASPKPGKRWLLSLAEELKTVSLQIVP